MQKERPSINNIVLDNDVSNFSNFDLMSPREIIDYLMPLIQDKQELIESLTSRVALLEREIEHQIDRKEVRSET